MTGFIDAHGFAHSLLRAFLPEEIPLFLSGPTPDFTDTMVVYQIPDVEPIRQGWMARDAVDLNLLVHCFDRNREKALALADRLLDDLYSAYMTGSVFSDGDSKVRVTRVEIVQLPVAHNDELVNDQQIYRFDFNVDIIARRV